MSVSIPPIFNPYALPVVTRTRHPKDQQSERDASPRRDDAHPHAGGAPPDEAPQTPTGDDAARRTVGTIINVRA